jgi:hypothetical protein
MGCFTEMNTESSSNSNENLLIQNVQDDYTTIKSNTSMDLHLDSNNCGNDNTYTIIDLDDIPLPSTPPPPYSQYIDHHNDFQIYNFEENKTEINSLNNKDEINGNHVKFYTNTAQTVKNIQITKSSSTIKGNFYYFILFEFLISKTRYLFFFYFNRYHQYRHNR